MMNNVRINIPYDASMETHNQSQDRMLRQAFECNIRFMKWYGSTSTPKNWIGYNNNNPSPGVNINIHEWTIPGAVNDEDLLCFILKTNGKIISKNE